MRLFWILPEQLAGLLMADLRDRIAWLLWCANEGYLTDADRAGVSNIFTADPRTLHPDDAFSLPKWRGMADAVIAELGEIPDRSFVDDHGRTWEWCGGEPETWAWRIANLRTGTDEKGWGCG